MSHSNGHAATLIHVLQGAAGTPPPFIPCSQGLHCHISVPVTVPCTARGAQPCNALCPLGGNAVPLHGSGCNTTSPSMFCTAHGAIQHPPLPPYLKNAMSCTACVQCNSPPNTATPCTACVQCNPPINTLHSPRCNATPPEHCNVPYSSGHSATPPNP